MPNPRRLFPDRLVYWDEISVALGPGMNFGDFQTVGASQPLRVDFRTPNDGNFSGETPQRVAGRDRAGVRQRSRDDRARARENRHRG